MTDALSTKQQIRRTRLTAQGLCGQCGKEPLAPGSTGRGLGCLEISRMAARRRLGIKAWTPGGVGRPPLSLRDQRERRS